MSVGIRDIAKRAQVSTATVNRVLKGSHAVSSGLAARVEQAVVELDYVPNGVARNLTSQRTQLIGLIVADLTNPFSAQIARGVEDYAAERDHHVIIGSSDLQDVRENQYGEVFLSRIVDGVIATPSGQGEGPFRRFIDKEIPLVFVDRHVPTMTVPTVEVDNFTAAKDAVAELIRMGHTDIAMITGPLHFDTASRRLDGYEAALSDAGLEVMAGSVYSDFVRVEGGKEAVGQILASRRRPTAIFCFNNLIAVGAMQALGEAGISIPDEMSLVTFDDLDLLAAYQPSVSAIEQPAYEMGAAAAKLLLDQLSGLTVAPDTKITFPTRLHWRDSCSPPRRV